MSSATNSPFVIFLSIQGVIYGRTHEDEDNVYIKVKELYPKATKYDNKMCSLAATYFFDQTALKNLSELIIEIEKTVVPVWIVISSGWRDVGTVEELKNKYFSAFSFSRYIVDKTGALSFEESKSSCKAKAHIAGCKAAEIQSWLKKHPEVIHFVVLGNREVDLRENFGDKFIQVNSHDLLTSANVQEILRLQKDITPNPNTKVLDHI